MLVYDITNKTTFENISNWLNDSKNNLGSKKDRHEMIGKGKSAQAAQRVFSEEGGGELKDEILEIEP